MESSVCVCDIGRVIDKVNVSDAPLLQITLDDINSVPAVYYNGEQIDKKIRVSFDWKTSDCCNEYPTYIKLEHADKDSKGFDIKTTQHNQLIDEEEIELIKY